MQAAGWNAGIGVPDMSIVCKRAYASKLAALFSASIDAWINGYVEIPLIV